MDGTDSEESARIAGEVYEAVTSEVPLSMHN